MKNVFIGTLLLAPNAIFACETFKTCSKTPFPTASTTFFLDLNKGENEINCARKQACEDGQIFEVFPGNDASVDKKNYKVKLEEKISVLANKKSPVETLILSGHDGGSNYGGERGDFSFNDLKKITEKYPVIKNSVKSYFGWGCYTATISEVDSKMLTIFPNLDLIMGYDLKAPLSDKPAGYSYLYDALKAKNKLEESKNLNEFKKNLEVLDYFNEMSLAAYVKTVKCITPEGIKIFNPNDDGLYYSSIYGYQSLKEAKEECRYKIESVKAEVSYYYKVVLGEEKLEKRSDDSRIRKFYNGLKSIEGCLTREEMREFPMSDSVILLIYDDYVMANFFRNYKDELEELKKMMELAYPGKDLASLLPNEKDVSDPNYRKIIADKLFKLNKEIIGMTTTEPKTLKQYTPEERKELKMKIQSLDPDKKKVAMAVDKIQTMLQEFRLPIQWRDDKNSTFVMERILENEFHLPPGAILLDQDGNQVEVGPDGIPLGGPPNEEGAGVPN